MKLVRLQIILSAAITGRTGRIVSAQLLAGTIDEDWGPIEMLSETVGDRWSVSTLSMFLDPRTPEGEQKRKASWAKGERSLWFDPLDAIRPIQDDEIFHTLELAENGQGT